MRRPSHLALLSVFLVCLAVSGCGATQAAKPTTTTSDFPAPSTTQVTSPTVTSTSLPSILAGASLVDLSWVSANQGWALAECNIGTCFRIAHTLDGGTNWQMLPDPPASSQNGHVDCSKTACVAKVRFASPSVGYLFDPSLEMTTNGGKTWILQHGLATETLHVVGGEVYRVAYTNTGCPGPCQPTLQRSSAGSSTWKTLIGALQYPDRSGSAQIASSGSNLLVAMYGSPPGPVSAQAIVYRSGDGGATWSKMTDPCSGKGPGGANQEEDLIRLTAAPGGYFAGLCSPHTGFATFLVSSTDGGLHWNVAGTLPGSQGLSILSAATPTTLAVATGSAFGKGPFTATLLMSTDGGKNWSVAASDSQTLIAPAAIPAWLGFETARVGRWISGPNSIWATSDGGFQWKRSKLG